MNITLVSYNAEERTATIRVGRNEKTISGLGDMSKRDLVAYLTAIANQEFAEKPALEADLSDFVGKRLPDPEDIEE